MKKETIASRRDFRIDTFRAGGKGGQKQNVTDSGVRITHLPSDLSAECRETPKQHINKRRAFGKLAPQVVEWWKLKTVQSRSGNCNKKEVRVYNEKRGTVKDHRTGVTLPMKKVLNGDIGKFIKENLRLGIEGED
jgi:protein subunit release factor A